MAMVPFPTGNEFGSRLIDLFAALLLATTFAIVGFRHIRTALRTYAVHSGILAIVALLAAIYGGNPHIYVAVVLTVAVKVVAIPAILSIAARKTGSRREEDPPLTIPGTYIASGALTVLAYAITRPLLPAADDSVFLARDALSAGTAIILIGFLIMFTRRKALSQVIGLLTLENGLFLGAMAATNGMPLVVEIGIFFDIIVGAIVLATLTLQISDLFDSTDTTALNRLSEE